MHHHHHDTFLYAAVASVADLMANRLPTVVSLVAVVCTLVSTGVNLMRFLDDRREKRAAARALIARAVRLYSPEEPPR